MNDYGSEGPPEHDSTLVSHAIPTDDGARKDFLSLMCIGATNWHAMNDDEQNEFWQQQKSRCELSLITTRENLKNLGILFH